VREVAQRLLAQAVRPRSRPSSIPRWPTGRRARLVGDPSKLIAATGWQPRHTLDDTLTDMLRRQSRNAG